MTSGHDLREAGLQGQSILAIVVKAEHNFQRHKMLLSLYDTGDPTGRNQAQRPDSRRDQEASRGQESRRPGSWKQSGEMRRR